MDKVVVIGGGGFIGSHTADVLSDRGFEVTIFDSQPSSYLRADQKMVVGDILDLDKLNAVLNGAKYLYQFAGIADIGEAKERPFDTVNVNVMGTTAALDAAVNSGVERFIYASTMYVYSPYGSFYRASKQAAEIIIETYHERFELGYSLLRYGSLYGPRSQPWNGLRRYVSQVIQEGKLDYRGTGKERREYIHVSDAARLSVDILDKIHENKAITVTGHQVLNSEELIDLIFEISDVEKNVVFSQENFSQDHYLMTPYRYTPKPAKKLVPAEFIDLGQGVLEIIEDVHRNLNNSK
jgi:UDP-glucose 4-epimerase